MADEKMTNSQFITVPYSKILAGDGKNGLFLNSRSGQWDQALNEEGPEDEQHNSFPGLVASIKAKGQETPVLTRPAKGKTGFYELIAGFRRHRAFGEIVKEAAKAGKTIDPLVKVEVRELSDYEARAANIRENTARENLQGPDIAWALLELAKQASLEGLQLYDKDLAEQQGVSKSYGERLLRIMRKVDPKITHDWRTSTPVTLTVSEMYTLTTDELEKDKAAQREKYEEIKRGKVKEPGDTGRGRNGWIKTAQKQAELLGAFFAILESYDLVDISKLEYGPDLVTCANSAGLIKFGKNEPTENQLGKIADAFQKGYDTTPEEAEEEAEASADDAAPAKGGKSKGKKAQKGKGGKGHSTAAQA